MSLNKNIYIFLLRLFFILLSFIIFFIKFSFFYLFIYLSITNFLVVILAFIFIKMNLEKFNCDLNHMEKFNFNEIIKIFIYYASFLILSKGIGEINSNVDMIFLKNFTNDNYVSLYGLINKFTQITLIPHMLLGTMILPYFAKIFNQKNFLKNFIELRIFHIFCIYFFSVLVISISKYFTDYLGQFDLSLVEIKLIYILNTFIILLISLHFHIQQTLIINRKYFHLFIVSFVGLFINLILNFYLVRLYNIYGAMISSILSHFVIYLLYLYNIKNILPIKRIQFLDFKIFFYIPIIIIFSTYFIFFEAAYFYSFFIISNLIIFIILCYKFLKKPLSI